MDKEPSRMTVEEIKAAIASLSPEDKRRLMGSLGPQERIRATIEGLQGSLDALRLSVKYLVFDLEATRRENQKLRQRLEGRGG